MKVIFDKSFKFFNRNIDYNVLRVFVRWRLEAQILTILQKYIGRINIE